MSHVKMGLPLQGQPAHLRTALKASTTPTKWANPRQFRNKEKQRLPGGLPLLALTGGDPNNASYISNNIPITLLLITYYAEHLKMPDSTLLTPSRGNNYCILLLLMRKLPLKADKYLIQGIQVNKWLSWNGNQAARLQLPLCCPIALAQPHLSDATT